MQRELARPDELALGLDIADDGTVLNAQGSPSNFLYALGPLRKGKLGVQRLENVTSVLGGFGRVAGLSTAVEEVLIA